MARWQPTDNLSLEYTRVDYRFGSEFSFITSPSSYVTNVKRISEPLDVALQLDSLNGTFNFDPFKIVAIASLMKNNGLAIIDSAPVLGTTAITGGVPQSNITHVKIPTFELRLVSNDPSDSSWSIFQNWDYLLGVYYMKADQVADSRLTALGIGLADNPYGVNAIEKALFFNVTRKFFDERLDWNFGARYAATRLVSTSNPATLGVVLSQNTSDVIDNHINPSVALTWHFTDDVNVRASYSKGFRFGGVNGDALGFIENLPPTFKSDTLKNIEVGFRSDWLDHSFRFDLTQFKILWSNLPLQQTSTLNEGYVVNIGAATIDGTEAQIIWQVPDNIPFVPAGFSLSAAGSLLNPRTSESFTDNSKLGSSVNMPSGTRLPLSAKRSATTGINWHGNLGDFALASSVQANFSGDRKSDLRGSYRLPGYGLLDASLRLSSPGWAGAPAISLSGTNLLNKVIIYNATSVTTSPGSFVYIPKGSPRTIKLNVDFKFN